MMTEAEQRRAALVGLAAVTAHGTERHREHVAELIEQTEYEIAALGAANILEEVGAAVPSEVAALAESVKMTLRP